MQKNFIEHIQSICSAYYDSSQLEEVMNELEQWEVDNNAFFAQIMQKENDITLEVGFISGTSIVDYVYNQKGLTYTIVKLSQVFGIMKQETDKTTYIKLFTNNKETGMFYTAQADKFRKSLKNYFSIIKEKIC